MPRKTDENFLYDDIEKYDDESLRRRLAMDRVRTMGMHPKLKEMTVDIIEAELKRRELDAV